MKTNSLIALAALALLGVGCGENKQPLPGSNLKVTLDADIRNSAAVPVEITLSATVEGVTPGSSLAYLWDLDGDGAFDDTTQTPTRTFNYAWKGDTVPRVKVTEPQVGQVEAALAGAPIHLDKGWTRNVLLTGPIASIPENISTARQERPNASPLLLIAFQRNNQIFFLRASPFSWGAPVLVSGDTTAPCSEPSVTNIQGNPTISYTRGGTTAPGIYYVRATNTAGTVWPPATRIMENRAAAPGIGSTEFTKSMLRPADSSSRPGLACLGKSNNRGPFPWNAHANDVLGTDWQGSIGHAISGNRSAGAIQLALVAGNPAVLIHNIGTFGNTYLRSKDGFGISWPPDTADTNFGNVMLDAEPNSPIAFLLVADAPAAFGVRHYENANASLRGFTYRRSGSTDPNVFSGGQTKEFQLGKNAKFLSADLRANIPWVAFHLNGDIILGAARALDSTGATWSNPEGVDIVLNGTFRSMSMTILGNRPAIVYSKSFNNTFSLMMAVWD